MATTRNFQNMLNQYLPNRLLRLEMLRRDYILKTSQKDQKWRGGAIQVPFKGTGASSVRMGKLTNSSDISRDRYVRGQITGYKECWGSMIFDHGDLVDHESGSITKDTFLSILPEQLDEFMEYMQMVVSVQLGTGPNFDTVAVDGTAGGVLGVLRIDRWCLDQKVILEGDSQAAGIFYVIAIDINNNRVTLSASRGGAAADISAYTTADNAKCYTDGANTTSFQSMRDAYLSAENGGSATLHGVTKLSYPYLQATNIDGSAWTPANILDSLFKGYVEVRKKARGRASVIYCSYNIGSAVMTAIENGKTGNYQVSVKNTVASMYGWEEITIGTIKGELKLVMMQEWDDDIVVYHDPKSKTFRSNGMFRKRKSPSGNEWFELRTEDGYVYIVDISLFGEMEHTRPGNNGIVFGIDPSNFA